jgi:hypothetical protein
MTSMNESWKLFTYKINNRKQKEKWGRARDKNRRDRIEKTRTEGCVVRIST